MRSIVRQLGLALVLVLGFNVTPAFANPCLDVVNLYSYIKGPSGIGHSFGSRPWLKVRNLITSLPTAGTAEYQALQDPMIKSYNAGAQFMEVRWHNGRAPKVKCVVVAGMLITTALEVTGAVVEIPWPGGCDTQIIPECGDGSGSGGGGTGGGDADDTGTWVTCYWREEINALTGTVTYTFLGCYY